MNVNHLTGGFECRRRAFPYYDRNTDERAWFNAGSHVLWRLQYLCWVSGTTPSLFESNTLYIPLHLPLKALKCQFETFIKYEKIRYFISHIS